MAMTATRLKAMVYIKKGATSIWEGADIADVEGGRNSAGLPRYARAVLMGPLTPK